MIIHSSPKTFDIKTLLLTVLSFLILVPPGLYRQAFQFDKNKPEAVNVFMSVEKLMDKEVVKVIKDTYELVCVLANCSELGRIFGQ